jgi:hypothetical protein
VAVVSSQLLHAGSLGLLWHAAVPRKGPVLFSFMWKPATPVPLYASVSTEESFSSDRSMIASSESGRRKSWRCLRTVASTPCRAAVSPDAAIDA